MTWASVGYGCFMFCRYTPVESKNNLEDQPTQGLSLTRHTISSTNREQPLTEDVVRLPALFCGAPCHGGDGVVGSGWWGCRCSGPVRTHGAEKDGAQVLRLCLPGLPTLGAPGDNVLGVISQWKGVEGGGGKPRTSAVP